MRLADAADQGQVVGELELAVQEARIVGRGRPAVHLDEEVEDVGLDGAEIALLRVIIEAAERPVQPVAEIGAGQPQFLAELLMLLGIDHAVGGERRAV